MVCTKKYSNEIAAIYGRGAHDFSDFFKNAHEFLETDRRKFIKSMPNEAKILDCGPGQDSEVFAKLGFNVTGIDITPEFVDMAKRRVPEASFIQMDMKELVYLLTPLMAFGFLLACSSFIKLISQRY
jgi:trans-aconitate methyltransferase